MIFTGAYIYVNIQWPTEGIKLDMDKTCVNMHEHALYSFTNKSNLAKTYVEVIFRTAGNNF